MTNVELKPMRKSLAVEVLQPVPHSWLCPEVLDTLKEVPDTLADMKGSVGHAC